MNREGRKGRRRGVIDAAAAGIEEKFRGLVPAAVPPGLRGRVLSRAAEARREAALAPWMRVAAGACASLIGMLLVLDPIQSRYEEVRLAALLDGRPISTIAQDTAAELAEAGIEPDNEAARWSRLQGLAAAAARKPLERTNLNALERLKGRWEYENPENPY